MGAPKVREKLGWRAVILAMVLTATPLLIAYAVSTGADSNQIETNTKNIDKLEVKFDAYQENQIKMIEQLGEINGYIKARDE